MIVGESYFPGRSSGQCLAQYLSMTRSAVLISANSDAFCAAFEGLGEGAAYAVPWVESAGGSAGFWVVLLSEEGFPESAPVHAGCVATTADRTMAQTH